MKEADFSKHPQTIYYCRRLNAASRRHVSTTSGLIVLLIFWRFSLRRAVTSENSFDNSTDFGDSLAPLIKQFHPLINRAGGRFAQHGARKLDHLLTTPGDDIKHSLTGGGNETIGKIFLRIIQAAGDPKRSP